MKLEKEGGSDRFREYEHWRTGPFSPSASQKILNAIFFLPFFWFSSLIIDLPVGVVVGCLFFEFHSNRSIIIYTSREHKAEPVVVQLLGPESLRLWKGWRRREDWDVRGAQRLKILEKRTVGKGGGWSEDAGLVNIKENLLNFTTKKDHWAHAGLQKKK